MARQARPFQILVVDSATDVRRTVADTLGGPYGVRAVSSLDKMKRMVDSTVDCLIVGTPPSDGCVTEVLESATARGVPVVAFVPVHDHELVRTVTRVAGVEFVFREAATETLDHAGVPRKTDNESRAVSADDLAALEDRIDVLYRRSVSDISEAVLNASRSLMGAEPDEVDTKTEWEFKTIGRQLDVDFCSFYRYDGHRDGFERTHSWAAFGDVTPEQTVMSDRFPELAAPLKQFDSVVFPTSVGRDGTSNGSHYSTSQGSGSIDLPDEFGGDATRTFDGDRIDGTAKEVTYSAESDGGLPPLLAESELQALCAVPVVVEWELYGVLAVGQTRQRRWAPDIERQLRLLGEFVGHSLRRHTRRQALERQNERLERFASVVSHDLQNPLNVITGFTQLAIEGGDPEHLHDVLAAAERMDALIQDLLTLAREGDSIGSTEPVSVRDVATQAWRSMDTCDAMFETDCALVVAADPSRLQQLLENLFKNAVEHGDRAGTIRVVETDTGFAVEDDGPGIPEADRDLVFQDGYTGGNGTGLGLSIVESIVDAHGWSIDVTAGRSGGARFEINTANESTRSLQ